MALLLATANYIVTARDLHVDYYNYSDHKIIEIPTTSKLNEKDYISDIAVSDDGKYLALITASSKQLMVYDLLQMEHLKTFIIPRSASKIRFTIHDNQILVADKSGDILLYDLKDKNSGTKLSGHLSLLLDVLKTSDSKYIISCDRDEKIKVSCYPETYIIQTYCLGHKEFVNHIDLLPHNEKFLTSTSGDGTIKVWDYLDGKLHYTIDTSLDLNDDQMKQNFIKKMDDGGIEVSTLPIVHFSIAKINKNCSIAALTVHAYNCILLYRIITTKCQFSHVLEHRLELETFPSAVIITSNTIFVYDDKDCTVNTHKLVVDDEKISTEAHSQIKMFKNINTNIITTNIENKEELFETIKVLYKRKFDNVQEYQERKKQRLEKSSK